MAAWQNIFITSVNNFDFEISYSQLMDAIASLPIAPLPGTGILQAPEILGMAQQYSIKIVAEKYYTCAAVQYYGTL